MKMPSFKLRKKLVAIWSLFSLFVNMAQPAIIAYAEEAPSPEPTVEPSIESSPEPTVEPSASPIESTDPSPSPTPTPDATVEPSPSLEPSSEPSLEPSPVATENPVNPEPTLDSSPAPPKATPTPDLNEELNISLIEHALASTIEEFDLEVTESGSATLATDKADYAPTDTAIITGSSFLANTTYSLTITSTDEPATSTTVDVTTDAEGSLFYAYQLDGTYRPNYKVEAYLAGTLVATITFTDSLIPAFTWPTTWNDYLVNGLAIYDDEKIGGHADPSSGGTAVSPESIDIASGAVFSGTNPGSQSSVQLRTDFDLNYIFYRIRLAGDPFATSGGSSRHWDVLLDIDGDGYKEYVIDMDNNGDVFGVYYNNDNSNIYDPITNDVWTVIDPITEGYVRSVPEDYGTVSTSDDQYYIDFAVPTSVFGADLAAVLAAEAIFYSTSTSNTDPLQKDYMGFSGFIFGINKETSLDGSTWSETETLDAGEEVYFKVTLTNTGNANLTDVSLQDTLPAGFTYVNGSTTGATTSDPSISSQVLTWAGPFTINTNTSISLFFRATTPAVSTQTEFTNTVDAYFDTSTLLGTDTSLVVVDPGTGTLRVIKIVTTDNGGVASADDFSFQVNGDTAIGFEADGQNDLTVIPGTYTVTEPAFPGYSTSYDNCTSVEVTADNVTTCTITNDDEQAYITLVKVVTNDDGGTALPDDFDLTLEGSSVLSSATTPVNPGTYTAAETLLPGYSFTGFSGDCDELGEITVALGESKTCTLTNDDIAPTLTLVKTVVSDNGGTLGVADFPLFIDSTQVTSGEPATVSAGIEYTASETTQTGYLGSIWGGDCAEDGTITLLPGENLTCTITNNDVAPILTLIKNVINDNGGTLGVADFGLYINDLLVTSGEGEVLSAGDYLASEDTVEGYSPSSWSGDCDADGNISLSVGDNKTCTITNDDEPGTLVVTKVTLPESTSTLFSITATGSGVIQGDATQSVADGSPVTYTLDAGTYSVSELETDGWIETENDCTDVVVTNGNESSCTIENTKLGSVTVNKNVDTDGDGTVDVYGATDWLFELETKDYAMGTTVAVEPGTYTLSEFEESDYHFVSLFCDDVDQEGMNAELTVEPGQDIVCTYTNARDTGSITVNKVIDTDGDLETIEDQTLGANWAFSLDGEVEATTSGSGSLTFSDLVTDSYDLTELTEDGYDLVFATCGDENGDFDGDTVYSLEVEKDTITTCTFYNSPNGVLHGRKWLDIDGEGDLDELQNLLSGWTINLYLDGGEGYEFYDSFVTDDGDHLGWYWFEHLMPGDYKICEVNQPGYSQTYPDVNDGCYLVSLPDGSSSPSVNQELANYVTGPAYDFGNIEDDPELTLTKTNDATGPQAPGSDVLYTLVLTLTGGILSDVTLTDTPPTGFTYRPGSWTVTSSVRGDLSGLGEPTYASPGVWTLGNMIDGEVITLTYIADVSTSQDSGNYKDLAWAQGYSSQTTRILAVGSLDDNFAGSQVQIVRSEQQTGTVNIETTGQVLGASTELPSTGASTHWLYLALGLLVSGLLLILGSRHLKKILLVFAFLFMGYSSTTSVQAATNGDPLLTVRMEAPTSPTRLSSWTLAFTTLDIDEREITVKCFVKKPAGTFAQFDTNKVLSGGGTGSCLVDSSVMNTQGSYEFYVTATAGTGEDITDTALVIYDTDGPGTPTSYSKEHPESCKYIIKFHTASDGGLTTKVKIYSSSSTNFDTHSGTQVGEINIGSDQNGEFTHNRSSDCDKTWYYVIRAFDSAGNQSGHIGDSVNTTTTITPSPSPTSALVVTESGSGSILGSEDLEKEGEVMGQEVVSTEESTNPDSGSKSLAKNKGFWWIVLILIALRILYGIVKKSSKD